ncbi:MAG: ATP-grasp domain-containing protein [archaeon]|nr:ATP-grasp domain-containing protein [Candidatus Bathyarchaeum sp.]
MNLLILEWISGGGYSGQKLSSTILSEGYAMLRCIISDCKTAGHTVTTFLDQRLTTFNPPNKADKIIHISSRDGFYKKLSEISSIFDGVYVIAPESGKILENLVKTVEKSGGISLNCNSESIKRVSNKMTTYETLKKHGLQVPETILVKNDEKVNIIKGLAEKLGYPVIFKPLDGVSCAGLSVVDTENDIAMAQRKVAKESTSEQFIIQKQIRGKNASVCVFSDGNKSVSATVNQQFVTLASPEDESKYYGGIVPYNHPLEKEALKAAEKAVEVMKELKGYVGVDIVLTDMEPVVMEINPRLTVSYIGLKKAVNFNPAQAIINATVEGKLPKKVQKTGYTLFSKVTVPTRGTQDIKQTYNMKAVVSPPFPVEKNEISYGLVAVDSITSNGARSAFYRTKKQLLNIYRGGA